MGFVSLTMATLLSGCDDFGSTDGNGTGRIMPLIGLDTQLLGSGTSISPSARAEGATAIDVKDLSITLEKIDGDYMRTWPSADDFAKDCENATFATGDYRLTASYGNQTSVGFDVPAYYGSAELTVKDDRATEVGLSASMSKAMFSFTFTEAFEKYMTDYTIDVAGVEVGKGETRPAYVLPGSTTVKMTFTTVAGQKATATVATVLAEARHHYKVAVNINGGEVSDAELTIDWDDTLQDADPVDIMLDNLFNTEPPVITADGFDEGSTINFVEGFASTTPLKVNIVAMAGLKSVMLDTESHGLGSSWPASVELLDASGATQQALVAKGLATRGLWHNPDCMAQIDFTDVVQNIVTNAEGNNTDFTVTVTDEYGRVATFTLSLQAEGLELQLDPDQTAVYIPGQPLEMTMIYNGPNPKENVNLEYIRPENGENNWLPLTEWTAAPMARSGEMYKVTINGLTFNADVKLRAKCHKLTVPVTVKAPRYDVAVSANNTYATFAYVGVTDKEGSTPLSAHTLQLRKAGEQAFADVSATVEGSYLKISGLTPSTTYETRVLSDDRSTIAKFTTEAALQLPNAGMEDWYSVEGSSNWSKFYPGTDVHAVWGTMNLLTTSFTGTRDNTAYCNFSGTRSTEEKHGGSHAAIIETVGWGANAAQAWWTDSKHITVGQLYLGEYNASTQAPDYGYLFASRPAKLTFWYKYTAKNAEDYGYAFVKLIDAAGNVLAEKETTLTATTSYTLITFDLSSFYSPDMAKAASVQVCFKSSGHPNVESNNNDKWLSRPPFGNLNNGRFTGSSLYVDDIELTY